MSPFSWTFNLRAGHCFDRTGSCSSEGGRSLHNLLKDKGLILTQKFHWVVRSQESCNLWKDLMCWSTAFLPGLYIRKKIFLPPARILLCSHHRKLWDCKWRGWEEPHTTGMPVPQERIQAVDRIPVSCKRASTSAASHSSFWNGRIGSRAWWLAPRDERLKKIKIKPFRILTRTEL